MLAQTFSTVCGVVATGRPLDRPYRLTAAMRLSWNEVRTRAAGFARESAAATYEKGETQSFYNEFLDIFRGPQRAVEGGIAPKALRDPEAQGGSE